MNDFKQVYDAITDIWKLRKKYGGEWLDDVKWKQFIDEGKKLHRKWETASPDTDQLFRDMFLALQNYYRRKEKGV